MPRYFGRWLLSFFLTYSACWFLSLHCPEYEGKLSQQRQPVVNHYVDCAKLVSDSKEIRYFIQAQFELTYFKSSFTALLQPLPRT